MKQSISVALLSVLSLLVTPSYAVNPAPPPASAAEIERAPQQMNISINMDMSGCSSPDINRNTRKVCLQALRTLASQGCANADSRDQPACMKMAMSSGKSNWVRFWTTVADRGASVATAGLIAGAVKGSIEAGFDAAGDNYNIGGDGIIGDSNPAQNVYPPSPEPILLGPDETVEFAPTPGF